MRRSRRTPQPAGALTDLIALHLGKRPEVTAVMIDDVPASDWGYGGQTQAQRRMVRALSSL